MKIHYDPWQKEVKAYEGDLLVAKGRRIGCTHIFAEKAVDYLYNNKQTHPTSQIVCASITEDQAKLIIAFATIYAIETYPKLVGIHKYKPTQLSLTIVRNKNARTLLARPVGNTGDALRAFGGQVLMIDEASRMPKLFWTAARPVIADWGGFIWMWSTFDGTDNYFYESYDNAVIKKDPDARFKVIMKTTEEVFSEREISPTWTKERKERVWKGLMKEKKESAISWYNQEFMAIAQIDTTRFFSDELIDKCCVLQRGTTYPGTKYMGCDLARLGGDEITHQIIIEQNGKYYHTESLTSKYQLTTVTEKQIYDMWQIHKPKKIGIDAGSGTLGVSVYDHLVDINFYPGLNRFNVIAMNNRTMVIDKDDHTQRMIQEDYYFNLKAMMEHGEVKLLDDENVRLSLRSIQFKYKSDDSSGDRPRIYGSYSHICEGLVRACWLARKEKTLNAWAYSISQI